MFIRGFPLVPRRENAAIKGGRLIPLIGTRARFASEVTGGAYTPPAYSRSILCKARGRSLSLLCFP